MRTKSCSDFTSSSIRNLTRGSGVSSKLRTTAAVSSVSLNWGIVTVLRAARLRSQAYTLGRARVSRRLMEHGTVFGYQGWTPKARRPPDVSPDPRLARIRRHVQGRLRPSRTAYQAPLHRRRPLSGNAGPGLSPRQGGPQRGAGLCRRRAQGAHEGRHHLPHLFDDQTAYERGLHDAVRGT